MIHGVGATTNSLTHRCRASTPITPPWPTLARHPRGARRGGTLNNVLSARSPCENHSLPEQQT